MPSVILHVGKPSMVVTTTKCLEYSRDIEGLHCAQGTHSWLLNNKPVSSSCLLHIKTYDYIINKNNQQGSTYNMTLLFSHQVTSNSLVTPWTVARQAPLSVGFSRQEYWSGLLFPSPGDLAKPGIEPESPVSPALVDVFFTTEPPGKPQNITLKMGNFCIMRNFRGAHLYFLYIETGIFANSQWDTHDAWLIFF